MAADKKVRKFRVIKTPLSEKPRRTKKGRKRETSQRFRINGGAREQYADRASAAG